MNLLLDVSGLKAAVLHTGMIQEMQICRIMQKLSVSIVCQITGEKVLVDKFKKVIWSSQSYS